MYVVTKWHKAYLLDFCKIKRDYRKIIWIFVLKILQCPKDNMNKQARCFSSCLFTTDIQFLDNVEGQQNHFFYLSHNC